MERLNIDTIGPLPVDEKGNTYIIVIVDVFSRFVELYPTRDATAKAAAEAIVQHIGRYGIPEQVLTDNGPQYIASLISEILDRVSTDHLTILPYSHEENSIVERTNKEVGHHLRTIIFDKQIKNDWSVALPLVQRIINASVNSTIGTSPASIIYGNNIDLDRGIFSTYHRPVNDKPVDMSEYMSKMLKAQERIITLAQNNQQLTNDAHIRRTNQRDSEITEFPINSYVLVNYPDSNGSHGNKRKRPNKLAMNYQGPYRVLNNTDISRYALQDLVTMKTVTRHVTDLRPFLYDPNMINPIDVARQAQDEFVIEQIIDHRGNKKGRKYHRTGFEVLVQWAGYDETYNTWEPYKGSNNTGVRLNEKFHEYCRQNKLQYLIPSNLELGEE